MRDAGTGTKEHDEGANLPYGAHELRFVDKQRPERASSDWFQVTATRTIQTHAGGTEIERGATTSWPAPR